MAMEWLKATVRKTARASLPRGLSRYFDGWGDDQDFENFAFKDTDVYRDITAKYGCSGELAKLFANHQGAVVHKWHHYIPVYERYFSPYLGRKVRFLEIGVHKGGSLQLWRKYFGEEAIIFGIDIDPDCAQYNGIDGQVRIGSQADGDFLRAVVEEMGGVDIVLDDGSHHMNHIPATLRHLFPVLNDGGLFLIEDLHTAYWRSFGGGYFASGNFFRFLTKMVHDMHRWYHTEEINIPEAAGQCSAIHIHDSIVVIEKNRVYAPVHSRIG